MRTKFWYENLKEGHHLGDLVKDGGENIKMDPTDLRCVDQIHLPQERNLQLALMNRTINLQFP